MKAIKYLILFLIAVILSPIHSEAKMSKKKAKSSKSKYVFYPPAPDTAHIQFLTGFSGSDYLGRRSKFSQFILGPEDVNMIVKPFGIFLRNGKLYVCDPAIGGLEIIDFENNKYSNFIPHDKGSLSSGLNCYVGKNDYLYVADPEKHRVVVFDSAGDYINQLKDTGLFKPTEVMLSNNEIWVTNPVNHTLNIYDKNTYQFIRYFNDDHKYSAGDDGFLYAPYNLFINNERVYITDFGDFRIKIYDKAGKYISSVGSYGADMGQFIRPKGIACDSESNLCVVDAGFENVQMFNKQGQLLMFFGGPYKGPGDMWLPAKVIIDYDNLKYFTKYVDPKYDLKYLIIVSNQYGPDKINVYGAVSPKMK